MTWRQVLGLIALALAVVALASFAGVAGGDPIAWLAVAVLILAILAVAP